MLKTLRPRCAHIFLPVACMMFVGCMPTLPGMNGSDEGNGVDRPSDVPETVPVFDPNNFSNPAQIDHMFFPQTVGTTKTYRAEEDDEVEEIVIDVLADTREVLGLACRVVRDRVFVDGVLIEDTHDWFAQDDDGNVWYMGEEVDNYEYDDDGDLLEINNDGAWEAGKDVAGLGAIGLPGYQMLADPMPGDRYHQEYYRGEAEDMGEVIALNVDVTLSDGSIYSCLQIQDINPMEPDVVEYKYYAPGIGVVLEEEVDGERVELVGDEESDAPRSVPATVPEFDASNFSNPSTIDNPFFPQVVGSKLTYRAETEDGVEEIIIDVPDGTREVFGLACRIVRDRVFVDGVLIEDTHDWYAQDDDGNIWYMGEEVDNYEYDDNGDLLEINHDGAWEAGKDVAGVGVIGFPGYQMLADPMPGDVYHQEYYRGEAEDMGEVIAQNVEVTLGDGSTYTCLQIQDINPLEPDVVGFKYYAPGIGVVLEEEDDERVELISRE